MVIDSTTLRRPTSHLDFAAWAFLMGASLADQFDRGDEGNYLDSEQVFMEELVVTYNDSADAFKAEVNDWAKRAIAQGWDADGFARLAIAKAMAVIDASLLNLVK